MGALIYCFVGMAVRHKDGVTCEEGMRLLAETLHPHGVPITWLVNAETASIAKEQLTRWHEEFGDDVALSVPHLAGSLDDKKGKLTAERFRVQQALPWADIKIAAGDHQDPDLPGILEDFGYLGLWGFCWEQIEVDEITDRGVPWGFYYIDRHERLRPAPGRGVVGMEWTARDLLKSFHSGNPCLYSTDPNDVARGGLCSWENIDYWKGLADNYLRNTRYNDHVFLLQHQEAHEMECTDLSRCYTQEDVREAAAMLGAFAAYLKGKARFVTAVQAAELYHARYDRTASSYMLWEDTPTPPINRDYAWSTPCGPWPKSFLFYDRFAQIMFIEGKVEPVCIRNYARRWERGQYFEEPAIPRAKLVYDTRLAWSRKIEIEVESQHAMPYGLALWGDYSLYQLGDCPGLIEGKIMSRELLFLRYDLHEGGNRIVIRLQGK